MTTTELEVERALARAAVYRLLGAALAYPVPGTLDELGALAGAAAGGPVAGDALAPILRRLASEARDADPAALAQEHVFLFDRQVRCAPHEGAYGDAPAMSGKGALLADIAGFYAAFGLGPAAARPDTEDHIAAELEFMSALAVKEAYALALAHADGLEVTRRAEVTFLTDHLGRWGEAFADAVREATPLPYFGAVAECLAGWIRREVEALGATPARVGRERGRDALQEDALSCPMAPEGAAPGAEPLADG
jgi:TorA maturation chaperone TorD